MPAQFVASKGAGAVITGHCGPKALEVLLAGGIQVFAGQDGSVKDVVSAYKNKALSATTVATTGAHSGMGGRRGSGRGMGRAL